MFTSRIAAAALAAFGAASAMPLGLAQLDFAGIVNFVGIDEGDTPSGVLVLAGVGGFLTIGFTLLAFIGAALALSGSRWAPELLAVAAIGGLVSALIFWIPAAIAIGAAAVICHRAADHDTVDGGLAPSVHGH
jgi:hypothetical protein